MATCVVTGTFNSPQGSAVSGATVRFNTQTPFLDVSGNLVVPKEITTTTATDGTWSLTIAQSITGNLTLDLNQTSLAPITKYTFSLVIPASASATFAAVWVDSPNYTGQVSNFPLSFSMIAGQLALTQLPPLANTQVWVGNSSSQATATATTGTGSVVLAAGPSLTGAVTSSGTLGIGPAGLVSGSQTSISGATNSVVKIKAGVAGGEQSLIFENSAASGNFNYKIASNSSIASKLEVSVSSVADGSTYSTHAMYVASDGTIILPAAGTALTVTNNALISGNLTVSGTITGSSSGNLTLATPHNHGVLLSGSTNATAVITPDASTSKVLVSGGSSSDPTWSLLTDSNLSGSAAIANGNLAAMAANTVKANSTVGSATPTDVGLVSTNTASTAVFRDSSGNFSAGTVTAALTGTASGNTTYTPSNHGVVLSGSANTMAVLTPDASTTKVLTSGGSSANPTWTSISGAMLPNPSSSTLGGVQSAAAVTHQWINSISTSGVPALSQPAFSDVSGSVASSQMPALTGDVTTSAGTVATTVAAIAGTTVSGTTGTTNVVFSGSPTISTPTLSGGTATISGTANTKVLISSTGAAAQNLNVEFRDTNAGNTQANWIIGDNLVNNGSFEIIPSTAPAGTTYSNPAIRLASTGAVTIPGTLTSTGLLTATAGLKGTATNDNASAGNVGEYVESLVTAATNVPGATTAYGDGTSISLTAGDWDVSAVVTFSVNGATIVTTQFGISTTSGNSSTGLVDGVNFVWCQNPAAGVNRSMAIPAYRQSVSGTTTVYLKIVLTYTVTTPQFTARLSARRVR